MTGRNPTRSLLATILPVTAAIGVFGVIYGATGTNLMGAGATIAGSILVFSGAAQFTIVGLIETGVTTYAVWTAVALIGIRHLPLGAVMRSRMPASRGRRSLLAWFLVDETVGLALASDDAPIGHFVIAGWSAYLAWVAGTVIGVVGGNLEVLVPAARAVFPVLFVGLAALTASTRSDAMRSLGAGLAALTLLLLVPTAGAVGALGVAVVVALFGGRR